MQLVEVAVPKSAKAAKGGSCIALQLNRRELKVPARLKAEDLGRYRGSTVLCRATIATDRNQAGDVITVVMLQPEKNQRKKPTHDTPFWDGTNIVIPTLQQEVRFN